MYGPKPLFRKSIQASQVSAELSVSTSASTGPAFTTGGGGTVAVAHLIPALPATIRPAKTRTNPTANKTPRVGFQDRRAGLAERSATGFQRANRAQRGNLQRRTATAGKLSAGLAHIDRQFFAAPLTGQ